ncbi:MAG: T9SS type A sorting domain-containing protein [Mariprofundaceae bacterium]|nr:T9SS type A sorting domain-containing protein [Mariprofundaceae bacterium]
MVEVTPTTASAADKGYQLIDPGYPHRSFLLKKVNNGLDNDNGIVMPDDGGPMPPYGNIPLTPSEIDLINVWILFGAPQTGEVVDYQVIQDYHNGMGMVPLARPAAPDSADGFQIHYGPFFLAPGEQVEYFNKHDIQLPDTLEITRLETAINGVSHHFIAWRWGSASDAANTPDGLRVINGFQDALFTLYNTPIAAWQFSYGFDLPEGTAYFWDPSTVLDLDYHVINYDQDSVLKAEVYMNFYVRPRQPETVEMYSDGKIYANGLPFPLSDFNIVNNSQDITFTETFNDPGSSETWNIWMFSSHTHKYGKDFDIYLRNSDGTKGQQVYEGFYNTDYSFDQGYFDYEHPALRYFEPLMPVPAKDGLIHEAVFNNNGSNTVTFGLTTNEEMMVTYTQYTPQPPVVAIDENAPVESLFHVYPNPATGPIMVLAKEPLAEAATIALFDPMGKQVLAMTLPLSVPTAISWQDKGIQPGLYIVHISTGGHSFSERVLLLE